MTKREDVNVDYNSADHQGNRDVMNHMQDVKVCLTMPAVAEDTPTTRRVYDKKGFTARAAEEVKEKQKAKKIKKSLQWPDKYEFCENTCSNFKRSRSIYKKVE